jgi:transcriptional/translational regulatory protein YebC/TACO1
MFDRKCVYKIKDVEGLDLDELELELIDYGVDEVFREPADDENPGTIMIYGEFTSNNQILKYLESNNYEILSGTFERIPNVELKEISAEDRVALDKLIEKLEEDEDVQNVFHTMQP